MLSGRSPHGRCKRCRPRAKRYFLACRRAASIRAVWADTILRAERDHLLRLLIWAALSIVAATTLATLLTAKRVRSPLLTHFALQTAAWGVVIGGIAALQW